ncbi:MAG: OB-fold domain-containing protein [Burkholderiaceae bacterium]|jgi:uncharacterized OB-fold protein|nr:OB-fold domain-containing protein [Burkholderiaceae bacterium]MEB2317109.1 OB-fold domain-containing protein [Pseudomonadota bacterium]
MSAAAPFVEGLARREVRYQACTGCGHAQTLARHACSRCGATTLEWRRAAGMGTVYSSTVVMRAPSQAYRALAPYTIVIVTLDEGCRVMGHATPGIAIGDRVAAGFFEFDGRPLLRFAPASDDT